MTRAFRSPRRIAAVTALLVGLLTGSPTGVLGQSAGGGSGSTASAILSQDGWWNRAKGPVEGEPANPLRGAIGGMVPAPSTVPETGLGVGAVGGDPDKVAAVGIVLETDPDPFVDSLVLTLRETTESGSNLNANQAAIIACPIVGFWAGVRNGDWVTRPSCDDSQAVRGTRAADGTWTFDLTLLASQWVDPTSGLDQNGVLLVESVDAPQSFQVSFSDISTGKATTSFSVTPGFSDETFTDGSFEGGSSFDTGSSFEATTDDLSGTSFATTVEDTSSFATEGGFATPAAPTPAAPAVAAVTQTAAPTAQARPAAVIGLFDRLPLVALLFLLLLVAGAAWFLGMVLGPLGTPSADGLVARNRGVSRALAERASGAR